jgi:hypothetical protein
LSLLPQISAREKIILAAAPHHPVLAAVGQETAGHGIHGEYVAFQGGVTKALASGN